MKTRKGYPLSTGALLLVVTALLGFAAWGPGTAIAAPVAQVPGAAMTPLPDAACTLAGTTRTCHLWALAGSLTMPTGASIPIWGFTDGTDLAANGAAQVPGPVISANPGDTLVIVLHNQLAGQTVSLHFPGQEGLVPDLTGVATGGTKTYTFPVPNSGTFLYEAGLTSGGSRQVAMGLFGPLVVADSTPLADQEVLLVFSEIDPDFNANPVSFSLLQFAPQYWLINGKAYPDTGWIGVTAGQTVLVRYLNAGVQHRSLGLLGLSQSIVRKDGAALPFPMGAVLAAIPPGQSVDATVAVPATAAQDTAYALYDASMRQHNNNQHLGTKVAFGGMLTFFQVTTGGAPPPDTTGPQVAGLGLSPNPTNNSPVTLTGTANDTTTGGGTVTAALYQIDGGGWLPMTVTQPPATVSGLSASIPTAGLAVGPHTVEVQAQDNAGNWGAIVSTSLVIDRTGPNVSAILASPNPTNGSPTITLTGTATDGSNIAAAEWFEGADPGAGNGTAMAAADGAFNSPTENLTASVNVSAWANGSSHTLFVRARDAAGNWSLTGSVVVVKSSDQIFADGFESGNFSAWSSEFDAENDQSVTAAAALVGTRGMASVIDNNTAMYVQNNSPVAEAQYHARFYFDPNSIPMANGNAHFIFAARSSDTNGVEVARVEFRKNGTTYQVRASVRNDAGQYINTAWYTISDAPHPIEIAWQASTGPGANNGLLRLYIDGALKQTLSTVDNDTLRVEAARLGPLAGIDNGTRGTEYYDAFVSTRLNYIGP